MLPRFIACLGKDTLVGFLLITFTWINTFSYQFFEICFDRIYHFYGKDLVCSRHRSDSFVTAARLFCYDYRNCFNGINLVGSRHLRNYAFTDATSTQCRKGLVPWSIQLLSEYQIAMCRSSYTNTCSSQLLS